MDILICHTCFVQSSVTTGQFLTDDQREGVRADIPVFSHFQRNLLWLPYNVVSCGFVSTVKPIGIGDWRVCVVEKKVLVIDLGNPQPRDPCADLREIFPNSRAKNLSMNMVNFHCLSIMLI